MAKKTDDPLAPPALIPPTLTTDEMVQLEAEARKEVEAEAKKQLKADFKEAAKKELRRKTLFRHGEDAEGDDDEVQSVTLNLAPHSAFLTLDGRVYYHGMTYKFTKMQVATVNEIIHRGWLHEAEINGTDINAINGRRAYNAVISPHG